MQVIVNMTVLNDDGKVIGTTEQMNETGGRAETIKVQQTISKAIFGAYDSIAAMKLADTLED